MTAHTATPRLEMRDIHKRFGATVALGGVELSVGSGEVLALVGENGAGKSTLVKVLSGAHLPDRGEMFLDGMPYRPSGPADARRAGVAMIYQELSLLPQLSVAENILLGMEPTRGPLLNWHDLRTRAAAALKQIGRQDIPVDKPVSELSIAERQLVEIARAVAVGCRVLVLDEPTSSLTQADIARLFDLVRSLRAQGHAVVYISHFLEEVKEISDRFIVLRDGRTVGGGSTANTSARNMVAMMVGRDVDELYPRSQRSRGERILSIENLSGRAKPVDATLELHRGEVLGVAGLVGAGRTELLRAIFGLDAIHSGQVTLAHWSGGATPARRWSQGAGMVSEDRKTEGLALGLSIADNITICDLPAVVTPSMQHRSSRAWMDRLRVRSSGAGQAVGDLSGGNQQKVAIARLLHADVDVLLLDEPTRGIDVAAKAEIYRVIDELACAGKAVLMVSSYLPELLGVCDRIAVMCRGVLGRARSVDQTDEHQIMLEATGSE